MVRGDDDQRIGIRRRPIERDLDGAIELDRLADLTAGVLGVILLVDRRAFDLQEEPAPLLALHFGR